MNTTIRFTVPGAPNAKAKKLTVLNGHARGYNDKATATYQNLVTLSAQGFRPDRPLGGPLVLEVVAVYARLACHCRRAKRTGALLGGWPEGRIPKDSRPDFDNLAKSICDGINAAGLWEDDARVFDGRVRKFYAATDEVPHVEVALRPAGQGGPDALTYLASPYSDLNPAVREARYLVVCDVAAALSRRGELVFSPIVQGHGIAKHGVLPIGWRYWQSLDLRMLAACDSLTVACLDGWRESDGVQAEMAEARRRGLPVHYVDDRGNGIKEPRDAA